MLRENRVTLIARRREKPEMDWKLRSPAREPLAFVDSVTALRYALDAAVMDVGLDIGCAIADRCGTADDFLQLLTALPQELTGDVLLIRDDGSGVLSAWGRGGDRVLYALTAHDVRFYLETQDLVTARVALEMTA